MQLGKEIPTKEFNKWIKALRSGEYKQTKNELNNCEGYCCLGVACKVLIPKEKQKINKAGYLEGDVPDYNQPNAPEWIKTINSDFNIKTGAALACINDGNENIFLNESEIIHNNINDLYHTESDHYEEHGFTDFNAIADLLELVYKHKILE